MGTGRKIMPINGPPRKRENGAVTRKLPNNSVILSNCSALKCKGLSIVKTKNLKLRMPYFYLNLDSYIFNNFF